MKWIILLLFLQSDRDIFLQPEKILKFAEYLEKEGDYYRAVSEYKRFLYLINGNDELKDSINLKIADLNLRMKLYEEALNSLKKVKDTTLKKYKLIKGFIFLMNKKYNISREYFKFSDTLYAWTFLREKKFGEFERISGFRIGKISAPNPFLASFMSMIIPGTGKIYSGRLWDGIFSLIINVSSGFIFYNYYSKNNKSFGTYFSGLTFILFYFSNIYGSYASAIEERKFRENEVIFKTELKLGIIKKFSKWLF